MSSSTANTTNPSSNRVNKPIMAEYQASLLFWAFFVFRYLRTIISIFVYLLAKSIPILSPPKFSSKDVTVVIPTTFKSPPELLQTLHYIAACSPSAIIIVTCDTSVDSLTKHCNDKKIDVTVLGVSKLNKRQQIMRAMPHVKTPITVLSDDDIILPRKFLDYLLAIFEDPKVGAGGPRQRVQRDDKPDMWNFLGISNLERRVWNNLATNVLDGSISTLSGRTAAYRTEILQTKEFADYFLNDKWDGQLLNCGDDKCLTRYVYSKGWEISIQPDPRATISTTAESGQRYIAQCLRWARAHWRGNFTTMSTETYWYSRRYLWGFYYIYIGQFQTPALLIDGLLFWLLSITASPCTAIRSYATLGAWVFFTKIVKLIPHFTRYPYDIKFIPLSILFSYAHGLLNIYSLFTLHKTQWGSQDLCELEAEKQSSNATAFNRQDDIICTPDLDEVLDEGESISKSWWYNLT